ncbi:MAG: hypothetical protein Q8R10_09385 [Pseudomonas sp.]|uniref:hypothetical protein n=1 Tax=Pseudomonas sp. TaxID=306 RepID=UPI002734A58D|nr:hypothetical protein [Pseudomonas sp.]MDP3846621.1 hypothetical protein [Pseudomonas sp.]
MHQGETQPEPHPELAATIDTLGRKVLNMSGAEVKLRLNNLDAKLNAQFRQVHPLLEQLEDGSAEKETPLENAQELIEAFRRYAQTALALRVLLQRRGQTPSELRLPFERETLVRQLQGLTEREQAARRQVIDELQAMARDLDRLLSNPGLNPAMQALLIRLRMGLAENLAHLLGGQSIENLPLPVEMIDFGETQASNHPARADEAEEAQPATTSTPQPKGSAEATAEARRRFWPSLWAWINAPWGVTWQEIR